MNNAASRLAMLLAVALLALLAVQVFATSIDDIADREDLDPAERAALQAGVQEFSRADAPADLPPPSRARVDRAFGEAFLRAYHAVATVCALLCVAGAAVSWWMVPRRIPEAPRPPS